MAIEKSGAYSGVYHVLHGVLSPLNSIGPDNIKLQELFDRLQSEEITEIILGLNPNLDSEATSMYILKKLPKKDIKITRLGVGLPIGSYLEYADEMTLKRALENRIVY
jgi:recombination protein RecR